VDFVFCLSFEENLNLKAKETQSDSIWRRFQNWRCV